VKCLEWLFSGVVVLLWIPSAEAQPQRTWAEHKRSFEALWNSTKLLSAKLQLDRKSYLPNEIITFQLVLENNTGATLTVVEADKGHFGGLNLYDPTPHGGWRTHYLHPHPNTLDDVLQASTGAVTRAKGRVLSPGERVVFGGPLGGTECWESLTSGLRSMALCIEIRKPGKYRLQYDSAVLSNFVEFTIEEASFRAMAVIPTLQKSGTLADYKSRVFSDGQAYFAVRSADGTTVIGSGAIGKHSPWDRYPLDLPISDADQFLLFPVFNRLASTSREITTLDLSQTDSRETIIHLGAAEGKRYTIRVDSQRKVIDRPKDFDQ
jgi:hypothetical protein